MPDPMKIDLSVTRAQFAGHDHELHMVPVEGAVPQHLANPLNKSEIWMIEVLKTSATAREFVDRLCADAPAEVQRDHLLKQLADDGRRMKAAGATSAQVRDAKARFMVRFVDRMQKRIGMPLPWIKLWMKTVGIMNKKGKLVVEFGGNP